MGSKRGEQKKVLVDRELLSSLSQFTIPTEIFRGTSLGVLEAIVVYFKDERNLRFHQIAVLLDRDERNIWTVYKRAKHKINEEKKK